jgi:hypothetical protein
VQLAQLEHVVDQLVKHRAAALDGLEQRHRVVVGCDAGDGGEEGTGRLHAVTGGAQVMRCGHQVLAERMLQPLGLRSADDGRVET